MNDLMFRGSHRTLTPLFSTATAELTSSKMDNIIALTTPGKILHDFITFVGENGNDMRMRLADLVKIVRWPRN